MFFHDFSWFLMKKDHFEDPSDRGLQWACPIEKGSRGTPKPLKMIIFSTFLMIFHQNGLRYRNLRDFGLKKGSFLTFFARFWKKPWGPPWETRKMGHFSGKTQYEIAITCQKSIEKGVRLGVLGGLRSFLGCQYPDISHLLGPSYEFVCRGYSTVKGSKSLLNTFKNQSF